MKYVYILDKHGHPLMPTTRFGHVRRLLKSGKAVTVSNYPFTVRLKYDSTHYTQPVHEGIDTGRENIGDAASLEDGTNIFLANIRTSNKSIKKQIIDRMAFRRERRRYRRQRKQRKANHNGTAIRNGNNDIVRTKHSCKSVYISYPAAEEAVTHKIIRGKEAKFANRKRPEDWLTPSARQLIQITMIEIRQTAKILPITHINLERVAFDFQKLENQDIKSWEYGKGPLYGYNTYKDYIWDEQRGKCACCKNQITQYHHINHRADGGIDHVKNIIGLCDECHEKIHKSADAEELLLELKSGVVQKYYVGLLNSVMPALIKEVAAYCKKKKIQFLVTDGKQTAETRKKYGLEKDHCIDAYAISLAGREASNIELCDVVYQKRRFKKKSKNIINARNQRVYKLDGKIVAYNRHKAMCQKEDSLEEFLAEYRKSHSEKQVQQMMHKIVIEPARRTYTFHKQKLVAPCHCGDIIRYEKYNKVKGNTKRDTFVATLVSMDNDGHIGYGDKNGKRKFKFCHPIASGCLQVIKTEITSKYVEFT